jgi:uncharacterized BrkB/YihY/UPF0761 family membrane protein
VVEIARGKDILLFASGLSFYALVSAVPLVIVVMWVASVVLGDDRVRQFAKTLDDVAPQSLGVGQLLNRVADIGTSLGVPALITALWPASSYGAGLRRSFDRISPRKPRELKGLRGRGLALVVLLPFFILGSLIGSYAGTAIVGDSVAAKVFGYAVALVTGFVGAAVGVALIYWFFSPERLSWRAILRGTLWSATTISLLSLLLTVFINLGADFQEHYATSGVAAIVLVAVWLFLANALLLVGYVVALES